MAQGYYLTQDEVNQIYQFYGGQGEYDRAEILNYFYVNFSRPRVSEDGRRILYSATLQRNSARGEGTPLWICSAIWCYDLETRQSEILYAQTDGGATDVWTGSGRTGSHLYPTMTLRAGEIPSTCLTVLLDPVKLYFRTPRTTTTM